MRISCELPAMYPNPGEDLYPRGGTVAGTSAGAPALRDTMPNSPVEDEHRMAAAFSLAPGLGLIRDVVIDQHFAQRGCMGRLVAGVAGNPRRLGIGIDEDTALIGRDRRFKVIGAGAVYVVDGRAVTRSNLRTSMAMTEISAFDLRLHVLTANDRFDVSARRPM